MIPFNFILSVQILRFDTWEELLNFQDHRGTIINSVEEYSPLQNLEIETF